MTQKTPLKEKAKSTRDLFYDEIKEERILGEGSYLTFRDTDEEFRWQGTTTQGTPKKWVLLSDAEAEIQQLKTLYGLQVEETERQKLINKHLQEQIETAKQNLINLLKSYGMEEKAAKRVMLRVFGEKTEK